MFRVAEHKPVVIEVDIPPKGFQDVVFSPTIPDDHFGSYGLVLDLGAHGREVVAACVRTYAASTERLQYPKISLDHLPHDVLRRLGVQAIRMGAGYVPTTHRDFQRQMTELDANLRTSPPTTSPCS